jgi:SSS family transporter
VPDASHAVPVIDYIIIVVFLVGVALWGALAGGKQRNVKDYFLGTSKAPWYAVCFAIVAAETSTLTFISIPGLAYLTNLNFLQLTVGYLLGRIVVSFVLLPKYFAGDLSTAYSFLENRFGAKTRSFASIVFLFTRWAADGVRLYATAIPLYLMVDIDPLLAITLIAIVSLVYTYTGGVKGVIWVDAVQMFVYLGGAVASIGFLLHLIPGGWESVVAAASGASKFEVINLGFDLGFEGFFSDPYTLISGLIGGAFLSMASHGVDQLVVQRLLATQDLKSARKALIGSGVIVIFQFAIFMVLGVMLYAFLGETEMISDEVFPYFILRYLPPGVTGFIIAGLFAAAMSTIAGSMSSLSSSTMLDLYIPFSKKKRDDKGQLFVSRVITVFWAAALVGSAAIFMNSPRAVVEVALSIASFTYGGLLGVFLLGALNKKAKQEDALAAFVAGVFIMITVIALGLVAWTWFTLVGVSAALIVGSALAALSKREEQAPEALSKREE